MAASHVLAEPFPLRHVPAFKALTQLIRLEDERSGLSGPTVGVMWRTQEDPYFPH
jgi:hypothetical protein